jgi:hypothetical protein
MCLPLKLTLITEHQPDESSLDLNPAFAQANLGVNMFLIYILYSLGYLPFTSPLERKPDPYFSIFMISSVASKSSVYKVKPAVACKLGLLFRDGLMICPPFEVSYAKFFSNCTFRFCFPVSHHPGFQNVEIWHRIFEDSY